MSLSSMSGSTVVLGHGRNGSSMNGSAKPYGFGSGEGGHGGKKPFPHIDDITSVTVDIDPYAPIERVLQQAETYLRQAESSKSFGRPDFALKDYIKASTIVVDVLKKNKGWVSLQGGDNKLQFERYQRLMRQIAGAHSDFEKIKADIKSDNARTGVQPVGSRPGSDRDVRNGTTAGLHSEVSAGKEKGTVNATQNAREHGSPARPGPPGSKAKPAVHPKPQALHGNAIKPHGQGAAPTSKAGMDLATRFANLRASTSNQVQDPRIRTQIIVPPPAPVSFQEAPPRQEHPTMSLESAVLPDLPKIPDAIYSPARGTVTNEAAQLPSSTPRGMFSRANSITSFQGAASVASVGRNSGTFSPTPEDYFTPVVSYGAVSVPSAPKRTKYTLPEGNTITAQELVKYMQAGAKALSILLIDIRSRQEFEEGHIMSQATLCIDSEILLRENVSATEIADSLVLSPTSEQLLFEKRHSFDLTVFYDDASTAIHQQPHSNEERAILGMYNALVHFDFDGAEGSKAPKLLKGGIEAWTSLMGNVSLQSSSSMSRNPTPPVAQGLGARRPKFVAKPIQDPEEAKRWEQTLDDMEAFSPIRTTDDFLRRFPAISSLQESMVSPIRPARDDRALFSPSLPKDDLYSSLPSPPTRPAPAVPRPNYSGLADTDNEQEPMIKIGKATATGEGKLRPGLNNPGVWCYGNSSLQALFATAGFSAELSSGEWTSLYTVPMKSDERIQHPQLLVKLLANLFHWMAVGKFKAMEAKTLMQYLHHVHGRNLDGSKKSDALTFGGHSQQDAQEYINFLTMHLHDETNIRRNQDWDKKSNFENDKRTALELAMQFWSAYQVGNQSIIDKYFRGVEMTVLTCSNCGYISRIFQVFDVLALPIQSVANSSLTDSLDVVTMEEPCGDLTCDGCKKKNTKTKKMRLARLPDRLIFVFNRFTIDRYGTTKNRTKVRFPLRGLDMSRYALDAADQSVSRSSPHADLGKARQFEGPFIYDLYATIVHAGKELSSGHYWAYAKDDSSKDPEDWLELNDSNVRRVKANTSDDRDLFGLPSTTQAYVAFYRRRSS